MTAVLINLAADQIARDHEGLRLKAYLDLAGVATIGYGHTHGVRLGMKCTADQAEAWLEDDMEPILAYLRAHYPTFTENQEAAIADFIFNEGLGTFQKSSVKANLDKGEYEQAMVRLLLYDKAHQPDGTVITPPGLAHRREDEKALFLK